MSKVQCLQSCKTPYIRQGVPGQEKSDGKKYFFFQVREFCYWSVNFSFSAKSQGILSRGNLIQVGGGWGGGGGGGSQGILLTS